MTVAVVEHQWTRGRRSGGVAGAGVDVAAPEGARPAKKRVAATFNLDGDAVAFDLVR
jgi:hypothetical protein